MKYADDSEFFLLIFLFNVYCFLFQYVFALYGEYEAE